MKKDELISTILENATWIGLSIFGVILFASLFFI